MCNDFLDSYNQSLGVCKVSSTPWTYCIQNTLPKSVKGCFGFLSPLGVKGRCRRMTNAAIGCGYLNGEINTWFILALQKGLDFLFFILRLCFVWKHIMGGCILTRNRIQACNKLKLGGKSRHDLKGVWKQGGSRLLKLCLHNNQLL
jgi:hypothetical protein